MTENNVTPLAGRPMTLGEVAEAEESPAPEPEKPLTRQEAMEKLHNLRQELRAKIDVLERQEAADQRNMDILEEIIEHEKSFRALEGNKAFAMMKRRIQQRIDDMKAAGSALQDQNFPTHCVHIDGWESCMTAWTKDLEFFMGGKDPEKRAEVMARRRDRIKVLKASIADNRTMRIEAEKELTASMATPLPGSGEGGEG